MRAIMKSKSKTANFKLEKIMFQLWTTLAVILIIINNIDAIRVYEGTNFPAPEKLTKSTGLHKKSSYISKRSWHPIEENLKSSTKLEKRSDGKWKDFNKRTTENEMPSLYKIKFSDENFMQNLKYIKEIPRLEEYTFCMWYKPTNLSHDQTVFFYSLNQNEILLRFWFNAADSTFRMAIRENVVYKVFANIREHKWHHICQSWNGVLGELQVFLDGKRIGAGVISHFKGTYIPEGGEVTIGQDFVRFGKIENDGLEGELFGFNLVDESVPHDQGSFINSQYKPSVAAVPPFKKLPPIKKTYQEIKAYISTLPESVPEGRVKNEALKGEESNVIRKPKEPYSPPKRSRGNSRIRYPPLRKVVIYNRDDRQLALDEGMLELNRTKPVQPVRIKTTTETPKNETINQIPKQFFDENYSIHSYKFAKQPKKTNYEIYEIVEDDEAPVEQEQISDAELLQRKARQNFNLFTARQANKVYTLSSSVKDSKKPRFHFETAIGETTQVPQISSRRSFVVEESRGAVLRVPLEKSPKAKIPGFIPVYEVEIAESRRKRSAERTRESRQFSSDDSLVDRSFRRLPKIPDSFINLFSKNATKSELDEKLEEFFPNSDQKQPSNILAAITEPPKEYPDILIIQEPKPTNPPQQRTAESEEVVTELPVVDIPEFSPMPASIVKQAEYRPELRNSQPVDYQSLEKFQEFNPKKPFGEVDVSLRYKKKEASRRKFNVSAGTDLVMRSYGACSAERGSPVEDTHHLVISWADTPVRIFGGAQVEGARNECGNF